MRCRQIGADGAPDRDGQILSRKRERYAIDLAVNLPVRLDHDADMAKIVLIDEALEGAAGRVRLEAVGGRHRRDGGIARDAYGPYDDIVGGPRHKVIGHIVRRNVLMLVVDVRDRKSVAAPYPGAACQPEIQGEPVGRKVVPVEGRGLTLDEENFVVVERMGKGDALDIGVPWLQVPAHPQRHTKAGVGGQPVHGNLAPSS